MLCHRQAGRVRSFFRPIGLYTLRRGELNNRKQTTNQFILTVVFIFIYEFRKFDDIFNPTSADEFVAGIYLYLMRLNRHTSARVNSWMKEIIPCDLDPERTISLPIRASDKCIGEFRLDSGFGVRRFSFHIYQPNYWRNLTLSTFALKSQGETSCVSFQTYMELAEIIREHDPLVDTILLSSEDARFVEGRHNFSKEMDTKRPPWRFILNTKDVMQGSGDRQKLDGHTLDEVFMSFYTTLQMQVSTWCMGTRCNDSPSSPRCNEVTMNPSPRLAE